MEYRDFDEEFGGSSYFEKGTERERQKEPKGRNVSGEKEIEGSITIVSESERVKKRDKERER